MSTANSMALLFNLLLNLLICDCNHVTITIYEVTNLNSTVNSVEGHWIAMQEINNNSNFLPNYTLNLKVFDSGPEPQKAITQTLKVVSAESNQTHISFPIVLGSAWSSLSIVMNPILGSFNMGQISASSTSITLSDTDKYPYFYR